MKPLDLIDAAGDLLKLSRGRPSQACLRRAQSTVYYALFHCLARECADLLIGGPGAKRSQVAWAQTYRALEHGHAKAQCENTTAMGRFPRPIKEFAIVFAALQKERHAADYDPFERFSKTAVREHIDNAERVMAAFKAAGVVERRAFCVWVLLRAPRR